MIFSTQKRIFSVFDGECDASIPRAEFGTVPMEHIPELKKKFQDIILFTNPSVSSKVINTDVGAVNAKETSGFIGVFQVGKMFKIVNLHPFAFPWKVNTHSRVSSGF